MKRRNFLAMLGLAPLAAKVAMSDALVGNLSSAYDYRFGNAREIPEKIDFIDTGEIFEGLLCPIGFEIQTAYTPLGIGNVKWAEMEYLRRELPSLYSRDQQMLDLFANPGRARISMSGYENPLIFDPGPGILSLASDEDEW